MKLHKAFTALPTHRRDDLVLLHMVQKRLADLHAVMEQRRPGLAFAVVGRAPEGAIEVRDKPKELAHAYASATVGVTDSAEVGAAMLACGLAVVLSGDGLDGAVTNAGDDPAALADAVEGLLDDIVLRAERARAGAELVAALRR